MVSEMGIGEVWVIAIS